MSQHTPGPDDNVHIIPNMDPHDWVAVMVEGKEQFVRYSTIAAAPELLAALEDLLDLGRAGFIQGADIAVTRSVDAARAAIAKAKA